MALELASYRKIGDKPRFTQLSPEFEQRVEAVTLQTMRAMIHKLPAVGKTLK